MNPRVRPYRAFVAVGLWTALSMGIAAGSARAGDIHVPADHLTIQAAIAAAASGDTVVVADGTYTGPGNRDLDFGGKLLIVRSEHGPAATIIDCQASVADLHRAFDFHSGETAASKVQGLTIRGGASLGGGIRCTQSSPTIEDCWFLENSSGGSFSGPFGGAVACIDASPGFTDCDFILNHANERGGAIYCEQAAAPVFTHCAFRQNSSDDGGAVFAIGSAPSFLECGFDSNEAGHFGGAVHTWSSGTTLANCGFYKNHAVEGGGVYCLGGAPDVGNCSFDQNSAGSGGALFCLEDHMVVHDCSFTGNTATGNGGALCVTEQSHVLIKSNLIADNQAHHGGGVYCKFTGVPPLPVLDRNMIDSNRAFNESEAYGGGLCCVDFGSLIVTRNVFHGNTASTTLVSPLQIDCGGAIYVQNSQPVIGGAPGFGNTFEDNRAPLGADLYGFGLPALVVATDNTFTVAPATAFYVQPLAGFDVSNATGLHAPILHDVVVSPSGVDQDGDGPFKTIRFVTSRVTPSPGHPVAIHLEPGTYSPSATGEEFPIVLVDGLSLVGSGWPSSIVDAESTERVVLASHVSSAAVADLTIRGGLAGIGGGLYCDASELVIARNRITQNMAIFGSGLACTGPVSPEIAGNVIDQNQMYDSPYFAHLGAGAFFGDGSTALFRDNLVIDNTCDEYGGAIACNAGAMPVVRNATIRGNTAQTGGAILAWNNSQVTVSDSILWGNHAFTSPEISECCGSSVSVSLSCVEGGWAGAGNIDLDPLFAGGDGALSAASPCIDAGDPAALLLGADAAGNPRLLDGDLDGVIVVDMGAEEFGNVHLSISGSTTPGGLIQLDTTGTPGLLVTLFFGLAAGSAFQPPFGVLGLDLSQPWRSLPGFAVIPDSVSAIVPPTLATPLTIYVQALAYDLGVPAGNVSNVVKLEFE